LNVHGRPLPEAELLYDFERKQGWCGEFDRDRIARGDDATPDRDGHHAGLPNDLPGRSFVQNRLQETRLKLFDLEAGIAKSW
jgi:hypothetical protein